MTLTKLDKVDIRKLIAAVSFDPCRWVGFISKYQCLYCGDSNEMEHKIIHHEGCPTHAAERLMEKLKNE